MKWWAYSEYEESGVPWLGRIPDSWYVAPLKRGLARNDGGVWGEDFDDDGTIVLRSTEIALDGSWQIEEPARRRLTGKERKDGRLEVGDLLVTKSSGSALHLGKTAVVTEDVAAMNCCFSNFTQRLRVNTRLHPRYLFWILNCPVGRDQLVFLGTTTTGLANLNTEIIGAIQIPLSTLAEQRAIAAFLDREIERIDALIARKERQIELLQEKRAAIISHAVTKGLDPDAPMKDSGVEWLGEIPAHWEIAPLKYLTTCLDGKRIPLNVEDRAGRQGPYPYWGANGVVDHIDDWLFDEELVLLGEDGAPFFDSYKDVAFVVRGKIWVNNHIHVLRPRTSANPSFLAQCLNVVNYGLFIEGSTRDKLTQGKMNDIPIQCPPPDEQHAIAAFLDRETERFDALVNKVQESITRLREYRTALISAAVTGKIQVQRTSEVRCT